MYIYIVSGKAIALNVLSLSVPPLLSVRREPSSLSRALSACQCTKASLRYRQVATQREHVRGGTEGVGVCLRQPGHRAALSEDAAPGAEAGVPAVPLPADVLCECDASVYQMVKASLQSVWVI